MTADLDPAIPPGFVRHFRQSPLTDPWEPLYSMVTPIAVILGVVTRAPHTNSRGLVHGGLITALADNAMGLSAGAVIGGGARLVTTSLAIDFLGVVKTGQWLTVETGFVKPGSTLAVAHAFVKADGKICARANATFRVSLTAAA